MKNGGKMKKTISLIAVAFLLVQFTSCKKDDKAVNIETIKNDGIINFITGNVSIIADDKPVKANVGDNVTQGMTITTAAKSVVDIHFAGSVIRILENSTVVMKELVKNLTDNKELTELYVKKGKMFTQVTRKLTDNEKFNVRTPTSVAGVRGTEFLVDEENGKSRISCVEGQVAVKDALNEDDSSFVDVDNGKAANVEPGKPITIDELTEEDMDNIRRIKNDIRTIREDIRRRFEEQREEIRKAVIDQKESDKTRVEEQKASDKANVEAVKEAAKAQVEALKGDVKDAKQATSDAVTNFDKPDVNSVKPDIKSFKKDLKNE